MIVISDTSPLNYLVLIGRQDILPDLFSQVIIPTAVMRELQAAATPPGVRQWVTSRPTGFEIRRPTTLPEASLSHLDEGEREAIQLALELKADLIIMDERAGREEALKRNLPVIGTLGILEKAAERGMLDFALTLAALKAHRFLISPALERHFLERDTRRKAHEQNQREQG